MTELFVHPSSIVDDPASIGEDTKIWHFCHVMRGAKIGARCSFGQNCFVASGVRVGDGVKVQNNVSLYEGVVLEDYVFCGPSMVFTNVKTPRAAFPRNTSDDYLETRVRYGASIGANATIVCGNDIGEYAFIGAGAVVVKEVKPYALVVGNPSRQIGWISQYGHRLHFDENGIAICPESKEKYALKNNLVNKIN
jgi:UDP-2-acetamido-3-amino-2,3-dideoxy-glucuronate N-acetyltransferase